RGGSGKRGARGGHDGDSHSGEYRGRGRGGQHRSRGKRDHYRGRGRGGAGGHAADFSRRDQDEGDIAGDDHMTQSFSKRKLESNWNRYEGSETQEVDEDMPAQRGEDYSVLLQSADSFTQFRFSDEKEWDMDSFMCALVDLSALAQSLVQVPLHDRLQLEAELVQDKDKMAEEVPDKHATTASVKKELTEEDLEDWLDSMIS
uniref:Uncharacterized protein n=1 Tax=Periophthalmus magnuspinnatus TaxID=409849 RepID=A0A3B4BBT4_9GOBI